jgi:protein TonB
VSTDLLIATEPLARRAVRFTLIAAAHIAVLWGGLELADRPEVRLMAQEIRVRLIDAPPDVPEIVPPRPQPVRRPVPQTPPPILAVPTEAPVSSMVVAPQPPAPPITEVVPPAPPVVTAPRFDADYLSNPKPVYPFASRRLGEEGKVLLRVKVSPDGTALSVEIKQSSGFPRLDDAARDAVVRWRFVPARRGDEAIESWVTVPIVFSLQAS